MGSTNLGSQIISVSYGAPVDSDVVNARQKHIREPGIYKGGLLAISLDGSNFGIAPLVAEIADSGSSDNQVRVYIRETIATNRTWNDGEYAVLRWTYSDSLGEDYVDIVATTTPGVHDIILGRRSGTTVDYSSRMSAGQRGHFLKVMPIFPTASTTKVFVKAGVVSIAGDYIVVYDQELTIGTSTLCYVYVNTSGTVMHTTTKATAAENVPLAVISRSSSSDAVTANLITDVRIFLTSPTRVDDATITRTAGVIGVPTNGLNGSHFRLSHAGQWLRGRNWGDSADLNIVQINSSNIIQLNGTTQIGTTNTTNGGGRIINVSDPAADLDAVNKRTLVASAVGVAIIEEQETNGKYAAGNSTNITTTASARSTYDSSFYETVIPYKATLSDAIAVRRRLNTLVYNKNSAVVSINSSNRSFTLSAGSYYITGWVYTSDANRGSQVRLKRDGVVWTSNPTSGGANETVDLSHFSFFFTITQTYAFVIENVRYSGSGGEGSNNLSDFGRPYAVAGQPERYCHVKIEKLA